ncbi:MAG: transporter related, partial [Solirubrobacteraceae bacterium]|nr:transporter related [Solirubrobacteraceae bacterium]
GKTIVFVTHDIDEAIKMGDKIAVLREGGRLVQYASPSELLSRPADEFVEGFVGADRALKRLSLERVADAPLAAPDPTATITVAPDDRLRDALSKLLLAGGSAAAVADGEGRVTGALTIAGIEEVLRRT